MTNILLIEDDPEQLKSLSRRIEIELGMHVIMASKVEEATKRFNENLYFFDIAIVDMHLGPQEPEGGLKLVIYFKENQTDYMPSIVLTGFGNMGNAIKCMEAGAFSYVFKGGENDSTFKTLTLTIKRALDYRREILQADGMALAICNMVDAHEPYTGGHCRRVGEYAKILALNLKLSYAQQIIAWRSGLVHDLAKVGVDAGILSRPAKLSSLLMESLFAHPAEGFRILKEVNSNPEVSQAVLEHHKRINGTGYPKYHEELKDEISLIGQIIGVVDSFDAMTTPRPYMGGTGRDTFAEALKSLKLDSQKGFFNIELIDCLELSIQALWNIFKKDIIIFKKLPEELLTRNLNNPISGIVY